MKKKLLACAFVITALVLGGGALHAEIIDNAGLLTGAEKTRLGAMIAAVRGFNLIILTEKSIGGKDPVSYSWDYLDRRGLGDTWNGCLLLQCPEERDYAITASGRGKTILNAAAYDKLEKDVVSYLRNDDYPGAYEAFIRNWEKLLALDAKGQHYNFLRDGRAHGICLAAAWFIALVIGLLVVHFMKAKMNTALPKTQADAYIVPGSLALTRQHDKFLYSTTTKTLRNTSAAAGAAAAAAGAGRMSGGGGRSSRGGKY